MQRCLGTTAGLLVLASSALALRPHKVNTHRPGAHVHSIANESFEVNQLGERVLLRVPPEAHKRALIEVSGHFAAHPKAPCEVFTDVVTLMGSYLGNTTVQLWYVNKSLHIKLSSSGPAYAGKWRSINNYIEPILAKPHKLGIEKMPGNTGFAFYVGRPELPQRPVIQVKQGLRKGLDVSLSNLQAFGVGKVAGLLGSYAHNKTLEEVRFPCENTREGLRKTASAAVDHVEVDIIDEGFALQSTRLRNLAHEKWTMNQPGDFLLLRVPEEKTVPALFKVRGSFVTAGDPACIVYMQRMTLTGTWFGNKTVHVSSTDGTLGIKVSSTDPPFAGPLRSVTNFVQRGRGAESLPQTAKVTNLVDGPSFKFQLGEKRLSARANILVTLTKGGGLDVAISHMERTNATQIGGLLGTHKHAKGIDEPSKECMGKIPQIDAPQVTDNEKAAGSLLNASWGP